MGLKIRLRQKNGGKESKCKKDLIKNKLNSDDDLPLDILLKFHMLTIVVRSVFEQDSKYHRRIYLDECLYEL